MRTSVNCQTGLLTSSWEGADGALRYTVDAFGNRGNQSHYMCSSLIQSCTISDINCGESLTMLISAMDNECSSVLSLGEVGQTGECQSPLVDKHGSVHMIRLSGPNLVLAQVISLTVKIMEKENKLCL